MKLVKTSVVACVLSALFASQVLAQDLSTDAKSRGGMQGKGIQGAWAMMMRIRPLSSALRTERQV